MRKNRKTFRDTLNKLADKNSETLMAKARTANRLAKILKGKNRQKAYKIKSASLCGLINLLPQKVNVVKDIKLTEFVVIELKNAHSGLHLPINRLINLQNQ